MLNKKTISLLLCVISFSWFVYGTGQGKAAKPAPKRTVPTPAMTTPPPASAVPQRIKTIFDYREELGLSKEQVSILADALDHFQRTIIEQRAKLEIANLDVQNLLEKRADLTSLRAKMLESAAIQIDMKLADIETSRKIEDTLTPEQLKKWRDIQRRVSKEGSR